MCTDGHKGGPKVPTLRSSLSCTDFGVVRRTNGTNKEKNDVGIPLVNNNRVIPEMSLYLGYTLLIYIHTHLPIDILMCQYECVILNKILDRVR